MDKDKQSTQAGPIQRLENSEGQNSMMPPPFQLKSKGGGGKKGAGNGTQTSNQIRLKRKHINLGADDKYGHWWTELGGAESYGWWPKNPVGIGDTLGGTEGELNGQTSFGGTATKDPHHGDTAEETFKVTYDSSKTEEQVKNEMRGFANAYSGEWRWTFGFGQNCHTFQEAMIKNSGVEIEKE